jgi:tRNA pseudouridine55 synthase
VAPTLHGILVIDKPAGWTSHDVVGWVRKWAGQRKVGHAGTLDPAATGVLPVALNDGTRVLEFLSDATKAYVGEVTFGVETDSADADGTVTAVRNVSFGRAELDAHMNAFRGAITQVPPVYSAVKIAGRRAYDLARAGVEVDVPERSVTIYRLELLDWQPPVATIFIDCSKGTYIRSIARDLGDAIGSGAHLSGLVRTRSGPFCLADAWTIDALKEVDPVAEWPTVAEHPDSALSDWPAVVLDEGEARRWRVGLSIPATQEDHRERARVYDNDGNWLGLAKLDAGRESWKPLRVINLP